MPLTVLLEHFIPVSRRSAQREKQGCKNQIDIAELLPLSGGRCLVEDYYFVSGRKRLFEKNIADAWNKKNKKICNIGKS